MSETSTATATFRTRSGICTVTPDQVVLTRSGTSGAGRSILRVLLIYSGIGAALLALGAWSFRAGDVASGTIFVLFGAAFLGIVVASRRNTATPVIERSAIRAVEAHPPRPPMTRGYFRVRFEEGGTLRHRLIILPGSLHGGRDEYERAMEVMRNAGLLIGPLDAP